MKNYIRLLLLLSCTSSSLVVGAEADMEDGSRHGIGKRKKEQGSPAREKKRKKRKTDHKDVEKWTVEGVSEGFGSFSSIFWAYLRQGFEEMDAASNDDPLLFTNNSAHLFSFDTERFYSIWDGQCFKRGREDIVTPTFVGVLRLPSTQDMSRVYSAVNTDMKKVLDYDKDDEEQRKVTNYFFSFYSSTKNNGCIFDKYSWTKPPVTCDEFEALLDHPIYAAYGKLINPPDWLKLHHKMINGQIIEDS